MNISIFGLGYVGAVSAACLAARGHRVIGVDVSRTKADMLARGDAPIIEAGLPERIKDAVAKDFLSATTDGAKAVGESGLSIVCVGTPSLSNGGLDFQYLENVCGEIGAALAGKKEFHVVVIRSTILPGTMRGLVIPLLEKASGKKAGVGFGVCNNPEFLREGSAVHDFNHPPKTVIGESSQVKYFGFVD